MLGGIDSATADMEQWMKRCAVVMQEGMVYSGSIISNIALSDEKPDKERCHLALKTACLDDFVNSLPMGLDTRLGNTGISLSGGQKQRLLIARAIYRNPEITLSLMKPPHLLMRPLKPESWRIFMIFPKERRLLWSRTGCLQSGTLTKSYL